MCVSFFANQLVGKKSIQIRCEMVFNPRCEVWKYFDNIVEEGVAVCKLCKQRLKNDRSYSLRKHMRKLHNEKSEVWKYFDNVVSEGVAVCKMCQQRVRNNRSFNLTQHLWRLHDIVIPSDIENSETRKKKCAKSQDDEGPTYSRAAKVSRRSMTVGDECARTRRRLCIVMEDKTVVRAVMGLMVDEGLVPQVFGSKNMQALLRPICEAITVPEEKEFKVDEAESERVLCLVANHVRCEFSNELHWRLLSLKIDADLNAAAAHTFCVSALFISEGTIQKRILGLIDLKEDQQLTEEHIKPVLYRFNIDSNQIVSACWDNAKQHFEKEVPSAEYMKAIESFEQYPHICLGDIKIQRYIGTVAQLCLLDVLKKANIFENFMECRNWVKHINDEPETYRKLFEANNLKIPQLDSPWRSGSTYAMIHDLNEARSIFKDVTSEKHQLKTSDNLWSFTDAFCKSMSFLQKSLLRYYNEELHFGDFYAQWLKCKLLTAKLLNDNSNRNNHVTMIATELVQCIEQRSKELLSLDHFEACLYLDPRFQHTLNLQQKLKAVEYLKRLWSRSKIYNVDIVKLEADARPQALTSTSQLDDDDGNAFLNEFLCQDMQAHDSRTSDVYNKIEGLKLPFQAVDTNILEFWQEHKFSEPEIYSLSAICFAMPATQHISHAPLK